MIMAKVIKFPILLVLDELQGLPTVLESFLDCNQDIFVIKISGNESDQIDKRTLILNYIMPLGARMYIVASSIRPLRKDFSVGSVPFSVSHPRKSGAFETNGATQQGTTHSTRASCKRVSLLYPC
jgi:hypothetical protein